MATKNPKYFYKDVLNKSAWTKGYFTTDIHTYTTERIPLGGGVTFLTDTEEDKLIKSLFNVSEYVFSAEDADGDFVQLQTCTVAFNEKIHSITVTATATTPEVFSMVVELKFNTENIGNTLYIKPSDSASLSSSKVFPIKDGWVKLDFLTFNSFYLNQWVIEGELDKLYLFNGNSINPSSYLLRSREKHEPIELFNNCSRITQHQVGDSKEGAFKVQGDYLENLVNNPIQAKLDGQYYMDRNGNYHINYGGSNKNTNLEYFGVGHNPIVIYSNEHLTEDNANNKNITTLKINDGKLEIQYSNGFGTLGNEIRTYYIPEGWEVYAFRRRPSFVYTIKGLPATEGTLIAGNFKDDNDEGFSIVPYNPLEESIDSVIGPGIFWVDDIARRQLLVNFCFYTTQKNGIVTSNDFENYINSQSWRNNFLKAQIDNTNLLFYKKLEGNYKITDRGFITGGANKGVWQHYIDEEQTLFSIKEKNIVFGFEKKNLIQREVNNTVLLISKTDFTQNEFLSKPALPELKISYPQNKFLTYFLEHSGISTKLDNVEVAVYGDNGQYLKNLYYIEGMPLGVMRQELWDWCQGYLNDDYSSNTGFSSEFNLGIKIKDSSNNFQTIGKTVVWDSDNKEEDPLKEYTWSKDYSVKWRSTPFKQDMEFAKKTQTYITDYQYNKKSLLSLGAYLKIHDSWNWWEDDVEQGVVTNIPSYGLTILLMPTMSDEQS